jgi:hypothetical protein
MPREFAKMRNSFEGAVLFAFVNRMDYRLLLDTMVYILKRERLETVFFHWVDMQSAIEST